jgi:hypothetical protein
MVHVEAVERDVMKHPIAKALQGLEFRADQTLSIKPKRV